MRILWPGWWDGGRWRAKSVDIGMACALKPNTTLICFLYIFAFWLFLQVELYAVASIISIFKTSSDWFVNYVSLKKNITVHFTILYIGSVFEICVSWEISWSIWKCLTNISVVSRWLAQDSPLRVARRTDMQTCPPGASPLLCKIQIQIQMQIQILIQIQRQM